MTVNLKTASLFALLAISLSGCSGEGEASGAKPSDTPARTVETADVKPVQYREVVFASGKLSLEQEARLSFKTGGIIRRIFVGEGQSVRQGQVLAGGPDDCFSLVPPQAASPRARVAIRVAVFLLTVMMNGVLQ